MTPSARAFVLEALPGKLFRVTDAPNSFFWFLVLERCDPFPWTLWRFKLSALWNAQKMRERASGRTTGGGVESRAQTCRVLKQTARWHRRKPAGFGVTASGHHWSNIRISKARKNRAGYLAIGALHLTLAWVPALNMYVWCRTGNRTCVCNRSALLP